MTSAIEMLLGQTQVEKGMHSVIQLVLKNEGMLASINISQNK
jgi:hypothetical protein